MVVGLWGCVVVGLLAGDGSLAWGCCGVLLCGVWLCWVLWGCVALWGGAVGSVGLWAVGLWAVGLCGCGADLPTMLPKNLP